MIQSNNLICLLHNLLGLINSSCLNIKYCLYIFPSFSNLLGSSSLNINELASSTAGFSSASLATLINESLLNMIKRDDTNICKEDIEIAKTKLEFGKKENKILDEEQKEILAIYQASKAFIAKRKISLLDEGISKCEIAYPSKSQLIKLLKEYLAGSIGIDIIKHEQYVVSVKDLKDADELSLKMTNDYKMAGSVDDLLNEVKISLRNELYKNIDKLNELKDIMIKNEVILESEIN